MTETFEDTADEVTLDVHSSFLSENILHTSRHNRSKNLSYFDSIDSISEDLSSDDNANMST